MQGVQQNNEPFYSRSNSFSRNGSNTDSEYAMNLSVKESSCFTPTRETENTISTDSLETTLTKSSSFISQICNRDTELKSDEKKRSHLEQAIKSLAKPDALATLTDGLQGDELSVMAQKILEKIIPPTDKNLTLKKTLSFISKLMATDGWDEIAASIKLSDQNWQNLVMGGTFGILTTFLAYGTHKAYSEAKEEIVESQAVINTPGSSSSDKNWAKMNIFSARAEVLAMGAMALGTLAFGSEKLCTYFNHSNSHASDAIPAEVYIEFVGCAVMALAQIAMISNISVSAAKNTRQIINHEDTRKSISDLFIKNLFIGVGQSLLLNGMVHKMLAITGAGEETRPYLTYIGTALTITGIIYKHVTAKSDSLDINTQLKNIYPSKTHSPENDASDSESQIKFWEKLSQDICTAITSQPDEILTNSEDYSHEHGMLVEGIKKDIEEHLKKIQAPSPANPLNEPFSEDRLAEEYV